MRIKFVQKIIDRIRCKKQKRIQGTNNTVIIKSKNKTIKLNKKINGSIVGDNNTIIFHSNNLNEFPSGLYITINGNENYIEIHEPNFINSYIEFRNDSSKFILNKTCKPVIGASFFLGEGGIIEIEKDCELGNSALWVVVNGDYKNKHKLFIGEGTHIAKDAIISQPLEICERVSEYGCIEKCFSKPNWSVNYADVIQMREPQQLGLVADVEVKYNE